LTIAHAPAHDSEIAPLQMMSHAVTARILLGLEEPLRVLTADEGLHRLLGFQPEEFLRARVTLESRIHPEDRDVLHKILAPDLTSPSGSCNLRFRHRDGRIRCVRAEYTTKREPRSGQVVLDLALHSGKTPWDSSLKGILTSFRSLMDDSSDYMYLKDANHIFIAATRGMSELLGGAPGAIDFAGKSAYDLNPESFADVLYRLDCNVLASGVCEHEVFQLITRGGAKVWIDDRKYPLRNESGEIIGIFGVCPNITEPLEAERKLRENRELLHLFIEHAPAALAMFDRDMRYLAVSRRWLQDYRIPSADIIGRSHYEVFAEIPERWKQLHQRALNGETLREDEDCFVRADGSVQWVRWELLPWRSSEAVIGGLLMFAEDITEQKRDREQLELAASVFTNAREGIMITGPDGSILDVNSTFTRITGYAREEIIGKNPRILQSGRHSPEFYRDLWRALRENGQWYGQIWNKTKDGRIYPESLTISAVCDHAGKLRHYVGHFTDLTQAEEFRQQMERAAQYDALTNLPNRTLLADRLSQAMAHARRREQLLAVACIDLDNFRWVNERCGHDAGDNLLMALAGRMKTVIREADTLARVGSDKFVAILLDVGETASGRNLLDRLLTAAAEPAPFGEKGIAITASIGAVFYPEGGEVDGSQLLREAEQAMYQAKLAGKNRCHIFDPRRDAVARSAQEELDQIEHAIEANELVLWYQPRVHMVTGAVHAAEALIRWQHPSRGLLLPAAFLPEIQNHELIDRIGEWVVDRALTQYEEWRDAGLTIPVSVNIAAHHLQSHDFAGRLAALLAAHPGIPPAHLELEILESSALRDVAQVSAVLAECREMGVSLSLDDFGTGYSSLTWLRRLPVDKLKIDQSFVRDMVDNPEDMSILEGVVSLAGALDRTAIAEGVETIDQGRLLVNLGCVYGQGFGIARPMPPEKLPAWAASWAPDHAWRAAPRLSPAKRALLQAGVAHRSWAAAMESYLRGFRPAPPQIDPHKCRLGKWIDARIEGYPVSPKLAALAEAHQQVHSFARQHSPSAQSANSSADGAAFAELARLRDAILTHIEALLNEPDLAG
jgi:diguanylate cyclase (GGDEF)-like protein/PAS domain S-box-containing protein